MPRRPARVTVKKAGAEDQVVAASSFKRKVRKAKAPRRLELSKEQRAELFNGGQPRIVLEPDAYRFAPGDIYDVPGSKTVWLGIIGVEELGEGLGRLHYKLYDERPRLLRASPHSVDFEAIRRTYNDEGRPDDLEDDADIAAAAEESAYTTSPGASLRMAGEEISKLEHDTMDQADREEREERVRHKIRRLHEAIGDMEDDDDFKSQQSNIRFLRNKVRKLEAELTTKPAAVA